MSHPTMSQLERLLTGAAALPHDITVHVNGCRRCRDQLDVLRALAAVRAEHAVAVPRSSLRGEVLRRAAAESPVNDGPARHRTVPAGAHTGWEYVPRNSVRLVLKAAAMVAALVIGATPIVLFLGGDDALGASSDLRFFPDTPRRGDQVLVEYRPAGMLDGPLVLRGRLRLAGDGRTYADIGSVVLGRLRDDGDGVLRGGFTLPDSVVYVALAVETADGRHTDTNYGRLWDLLVYEDGVPAAAALIQKVEDHLIRNWQVALATSRELTRLHPLYAPGWRARLNREKSITPEAALDSLNAFHRANLDALSAHWSADPRVDAVTAFELAFLAEIIGDTATMSTWKRRLYAEHPVHPLTQEFLTVDAVHAHIATPRDMLAAVDSLWDDAGVGHQSLAWEGISAAQRAGDGAAAVRWAIRYAGIPAERARYGTYPASMTRYVANTLASIDDVAAQRLAVQWMRDELDRLDSVVPRLVGSTADEHAAVLDDARRARLLVLATALTAMGEVAGAHEARVQAAELGWSVSLFRQLATSLGDDPAAPRYAARWAADPETSAAVADSLADVFGSHLADSRWTSLLDSARTRMHDVVMREVVNRPLRGDAVLSNSAGAQRPLRDLLHGDVTLVAYWSRWCEPSLRQLESLDALVTRFRQRGFGAVTIADEAPSPALTAFIDARGVTFPVFHDTHRTANVALGQWGTPHYFLLDRNGAVRFESRSTSGLLRAAAVLAERSRIAAAPAAAPSSVPTAVLTGSVAVTADALDRAISTFDEGPMLLNPEAVGRAARHWTDVAEKSRAVRFEVVVSRAGRIISAVPLDIDPDEVPDYFVHALDAMEFSPALLQGEPVTARLAISIVL